MYNIFFIIASFVCSIVLIEHLAKVLAKQNADKLKGSIRAYIYFVFLVLLFLGIFSLGELSDLLGNTSNSSAFLYVQLILGVVWIIFIIKYYGHAEKREKERLEQRTIDQ